MAKPNYSFEKRQRELAKKKKKEEKALRKQQQSRESPADQTQAVQPGEGGEPGDGAQRPDEAAGDTTP